MTADADTRRALAAVQPRGRRRGLRALAAAVAVLAVLAVVATGGIGWYYSSVLLTPDHAPIYDQRVLSADASSVTLAATHVTELPGTYAVDWPAGHAVLGPVSRDGDGRVTRPLESGRPPAAGTAVALTPDLDGPDPQRGVGLPFSTVQVPTPLGPMPAWFVPAGEGASTGSTSSVWAVLVHGRGATRKEGLRALAPLHALGLPVLDVTYRNDEGAPASPDGFYHLGQTEWQDVDAAMAWAREHGARRFVLYGWSMGGAVVEQLLQRSPHRGEVSAVVLDAPVVDWRSVLDLQAANRGLPSVLTAVAEQVVSWRAGIDWDALDARRHPVTLPTLLFHGDDDRTVPVGPSRQLARQNPRTVTYVEVHGADHTTAWNQDPQAYDQRLTAFLRARLAAADLP
ncbi:MAG: alpha/beta hydrolase family protein [Motilibacteraceae bacterium]